MNKLYQEIAVLIQARENCGRLLNDKWFNIHQEKADELINDFMPGGSGFDNGTKLDWDKSNSEKLVFITDYHHMNEGGYYDGWTHHTVVITPSLSQGFYIKVTGKNKRDIKSYITESFDISLRLEIDQEGKNPELERARDAFKKNNQTI